MAEEGALFEAPDGNTLRQARVKWEVRPALKTADFFEALYTGEAMKDPAAFLQRFKDEFRLATA